MIAILDFIFVFHLIFMVWAAGAEIISGNIIGGMKNIGKGLLSLSFFMAVLGHFLFGFPVDILFKRYITEGYRLLPILYKEFIAPIFKLIFG